MYTTSGFVVTWHILGHEREIESLAVRPLLLGNLFDGMSMATTVFHDMHTVVKSSIRKVGIRAMMNCLA